jgi:hypothetical protein
MRVNFSPWKTDKGWSVDWMGSTCDVEGFAHDLDGEEPLGKAVGLEEGDAWDDGAGSKRRGRRHTDRTRLGLDLCKLLGQPPGKDGGHGGGCANKDK